MEKGIVMRKSAASLFSIDRKVLLLAALAMGLCGFGIIVWPTTAQERTKVNPPVSSSPTNPRSAVTWDSAGVISEFLNPDDGKSVSDLQNIAQPMGVAPDYWNALPVANTNIFPFNTNPATGKRVQWIVAAGEFNQPASAPAGNNINSIWFRPVAATNATYTTLTVRMATVSTSTFFAVGAFYTGAMTTVLSQNTTITQPVALTWTEIPLTTPFPYDPTMNLIIEVSQCGFTGTGFNMHQQAFGITPDRRRQFSDLTSACGAVALPTGGDQSVPAIGITVTPTSSLGNYPATSVVLGSNATVTPDAAPANTTSQPGARPT